MERVISTDNGTCQFRLDPFGVTMMKFLSNTPKHIISAMRGRGHDQNVMSIHHIHIL